MPEVAVREASVAEIRDTKQRVNTPERGPHSESRGILRRIGRGRSRRENPDKVFAEIASPDGRGGHKNTSRRQMLSPRGVEETDGERITDGLSSQELRELSFDFDRFLTQHPPVEGNQDSEQHWARQQEAMMTCRSLIERYIEQDPLASDPAESQSKLKGLVDRFDSHYQFSEEQRDITNDLIDAYYSQRQRGIELRAMYPNDRELVRAVTGVDVSRKNKVSVRVGPWGLEITADKKLTAQILYRGQTPPTDFVAGGLADVYAIPPYIVLNEGRHNDQTRDHERQHIRYAMQKSVMARHHVDIYGLRKESDGVSASQEPFEQFLLQQRGTALDMAKDEIFAYTFNAPRFPIEYFVAQDHNPYDYLHSAREFSKIVDDSQYRKAAQRILVTEYQQIITSAAATVDALRKSGGYSNREVIALLGDKPVEQWESIAHKLLEAKGILLPQQEIVHVPQKPVERRRARILPRQKQEQVIDVVIRAEDKQPDWYEERMMMGIRKKRPEKEEQPDLREEQPPVYDISFLVLNKMLYDLTRTQIDFYNKIYGEKGLEQYFSVLDRITEETGKLLAGSTPTETELEHARLRLFLELEKTFAETKQNT